MNKKQPTHYTEEDVLVARKLWKSDPVATYLVWTRIRKQKFPDNVCPSDRLKLDAILIDIEDDIENSPRKINANDPRLHKAERDYLRTMQTVHFHGIAVALLTSIVAHDNMYGMYGMFLQSWPAVSKLLYDLEIAFDPSFYDTGVRLMSGVGDADIQNKVDALLATRQEQLAMELWECDSALATRYADVLRGIKMPLGLSEVEKRTPFLRKIIAAGGGRTVLETTSLVK